MNTAPEQEKPSQPRHLPQLAAIFKGIKAGRHWCFGDPEYDDLNGELFDHYKAYFSELELKIHRDSRGFIYATSDDDDYKGSDLITRFVVFTAVWVDAVADQGVDIGASLFAPNQTSADLPHLISDTHRRTLTQVGITTTAELHATLRSLERLGFVDLDGQNRFTLRPSFHRLLDVCVDAARKNSDAAEPENPATGSAQQSPLPETPKEAE